jgi:predicted  nucleic acid-binding Zn-ribbon protein
MVPDHARPSIGPRNKGRSQESGRVPVAEKREIPQEVIRARLEALRRELDRGHAELQNVKKQRKYLRETLLRIDGAVQVLEELAEAEGHSVEQNGVAPREKRSSSEPIGPMSGVP